MIWLVVLFGVFIFVMQQRAISAGRLATLIATYLGAGRTPLEALRALRDNSGSPALANALHRAALDMEAGAPLSRALASSGLPLPLSFVEGLRAVEEAGQVKEWLSLEGERFRWRAEVRGQGALGLIYPAIVLFLLVEIALFTSTYIMPTFVSLGEGMGTSTPWLTEVLIGVTRLLRSPTCWRVLAGVVVFLTGWMYFGGAQASKLWAALGRLPGFARFRLLANCEETSSLLGALLRGGLPLSAAVYTAARSLSDESWREMLTQVEKDVLAGRTLSAGLESRGVPPLFVRMCEVGEQAEDLPETLLGLGRYYQDQLQGFTRRLLRIGEVALSWSLGAVVAVYAVGVWLPMAELLGGLVK